jgi:hypothetical protein
MKSVLSSPSRLRILGPAALLVLLSVVFWKVRILDAGVRPAIEIGPSDLYMEHIPTADYGFSRIADGELPLWNPYQLCGVPFLAVPYTSIFYPLRPLNMFFGAARTIEIFFVFHMCLASIGMYYLARWFAIRTLGALLAAVTFMWSGWFVHSHNQPLIQAAMAWAPLVVLFLDKIMQGVRFAWLWLLLALSCQILLGFAEVLIHTMYIGALFVACRLTDMMLRQNHQLALRRLATVSVAIVGALLLCAFQLFPSIELVRQSTRAPGSLTLAQAAEFAIPPVAFIRSAVLGTPPVTAGALALFAVMLAFGNRQRWLVSVASLITTVVAALLIFGGFFYRLYYEMPLLGGLFRRPMKFLDMYVFGQALLVGIAVARLEEWAAADRTTPWRHASWFASLGVGVAGGAWLVFSGSTNWYWFGALFLMAIFGIAAGRALRLPILFAACALQAASLFFVVGNTHLRPVRRPDIFYTHQRLLDMLRHRLGYARVYLSPRLSFVPGLTANQGMRNRMATAVGYEPLANQRYGRFFEAVSPPRDRRTPFYGAYDLGPESRWRLMDLTGTRLFVMLRGEPGDRFLSSNPSDFRLIYDHQFVRAYEQRSVLPRAYFVSRARVLNSPDGILATLSDPSFDYRSEVLLEEPATPLSSSPLPSQVSEARITLYEPESVVVSVVASAPGYLVLTDSFYPGWKAFVGGREAPISRANYLFRAVRLDPGTHEVRFAYEPVSLRHGIFVSVATALLILAVILHNRPKRRPHNRVPEPAAEERRAGTPTQRSAPKHAERRGARRRLWVEFIGFSPQ